MSVQQRITGYKFWILLLLFSTGAIAKSAVGVTHSQAVKTLSLTKAQHRLSKDLLQPQSGTSRLLTEHSDTPVVSGYAVLSSNNGKYLLLGYVGTTVALLQDTNRCESVSRLLFPYHIFW